MQNRVKEFLTRLAKWFPSLCAVGIVHLTFPGRDSRAPAVLFGLSVSRELVLGWLSVGGALPEVMSSINIDVVGVVVLARENVTTLRDTLICLISEKRKIYTINNRSCYLEQIIIFDFTRTKVICGWGIWRKRENCARGKLVWIW